MYCFNTFTVLWAIPGMFVILLQTHIYSAIQLIYGTESCNNFRPLPLPPCNRAFQLFIKPSFCCTALKRISDPEKKSLQTLNFWQVSFARPLTGFTFVALAAFGLLVYPLCSVADLVPNHPPLLPPPGLPAARFKSLPRKSSWPRLSPIRPPCPILSATSSSPPRPSCPCRRQPKWSR